MYILVVIHNYKPSGQIVILVFSGSFNLGNNTLIRLGTNASPLFFVLFYWKLFCENHTFTLHMSQNVFVVDPVMNFVGSHTVQQSYFSYFFLLFWYQSYLSYFFFKTPTFSYFFCFALPRTISKCHELLSKCAYRSCYYKCQQLWTNFAA